MTAQRLTAERPRIWPRGLAGTFLLVAMTVLFSNGAAAKDKPAQTGTASIVIDAASGQVLYAHRANKPHYPASLTKMMTLYLVFEAMREGRLKADQKLLVSRHASWQRPSRLGLRKGRRIRVRDAVLALVTKSANDASVVLAEALGGTEAGFARMMTEKARSLDMNATVFRNASGLHDRRQETTALDMATLAFRLIRDFPEQYKYFSTPSFRYGGRRYKNHNALLADYDGADGIKTGYVRQSGYNLAASAVRDGRRLIGVVLGGENPALRDWRMKTMLDYGFRLSGDGVRPAAQRTVPYRLREPEGNELLDIIDAQQRPLIASRRPAAQRAAGNAPRAAPRWGIQVGAYNRQAPAERLVKKTAHRFPKLLRNTRPRITRVERGGKLFYRARLLGMTEDGAREACRQLIRHKVPCFAFAASG